jgi:hypothetical protein
VSSPATSTPPSQFRDRAAVAEGANELGGPE